MGFARFRGGAFLPARRLGSLGSTLAEVRFYGTGVVSAITPDSWQEYSEVTEVRLAGDKEVDPAAWSLAMEELRARAVEGEEGPEAPASPPEHQAPGAKKQAAQRRKLNRVSLQASVALTEAAYNKFIVEEEGGTLRCRQCPKFKTLIPLVAKRKLANIMVSILKAPDYSLTIAHFA